MKTLILVWALFIFDEGFRSQSMTTIDFETKQACEIAKKDILSAGRFDVAVCVSKINPAE